MKTSSGLGGHIQADYWLILAITAVFEHFFEKGKSGRITGVSGVVSLKRGLIRGWIWGGEGIREKAPSGGNFWKIGMKMNKVVKGGFRGGAFGNVE